jgi:5-formyltetrahydrofolate cyclo-ligase
MTKALARDRARQILRRIDAVSRDAWSEAVARALTEAPAWKSAGAVLIFVSLPEEIDTTPIIAAARDGGKTVAVPRVRGEEMAFHAMQGDAGTLRRGKLGIPEPEPSWPVFDFARESGVLVVVPGLAFDRGMHRLGRGKGFYDRFLRRVRSEGTRGGATAIAICFHAQLWEAVPHTAEDELMDGIITETEALGTAAKFRPRTS